MLPGNEKRRLLKRIGLPIVAAILAKEEDERSEIEKSCINAIAWISKAFQDERAFLIPF
jgi:hypothetical protein